MTLEMHSLDDVISQATQVEVYEPEDPDDNALLTLSTEEPLARGDVFRAKCSIAGTSSPSRACSVVN